MNFWETGVGPLEMCNLLSCNRLFRCLFIKIFHLFYPHKMIISEISRRLSVNHSSMHLNGLESEGNMHWWGEIGKYV